MKTDNSHPARFLHHSEQDILITTELQRLIRHARGFPDLPRAAPVV